MSDDELSLLDAAVAQRDSSIQQRLRRSDDQAQDGDTARVPVLEVGGRSTLRITTCWVMPIVEGGVEIL